MVSPDPPDRLSDPGTLIAIGMSCLVLANLAHRFLAPPSGPWGAAIDGAVGLLFSLSCGFNMMGLWLACRRRSTEGNGQCASR